MTFLSHDTTPAKAIIPDLKWIDGAFNFQKWNGSAYAFTPITESLYFDIFAAKRGWELWKRGETTTRSIALAPLSEPMPPRLEDDPKASKIYSVPVYSREIGRRHDLTAKGHLSSAFVDLFNGIAEIAKEAQTEKTLIVPLVSVSTVVAEDFSVAPVFNVESWMTRPEAWGPPLVVYP